MIISGIAYASFYFLVSLSEIDVPRKKLSEHFDIKYFNNSNFSQYFPQVIFVIQVIDSCCIPRYH